MSTDISGVGQPGFVARYDLADPPRQAAAQEVAARIGELGLRPVRLAVVDQHGVPRGKRYEIGRYQDALAQAPLMDGQDVSDWEMREYFEFF
jgi:hypothetical protein